MFLPYLKTSPSKDLAPPKESLTLANTSVDPKNVSGKIDIEGYGEDNLEIPKMIELSKILSLHIKLRNERLCKTVQKLSKLFGKLVQNTVTQKSF